MLEQLVREINTFRLDIIQKGFIEVEHHMFSSRRSGIDIKIDVKARDLIIIKFYYAGTDRVIAEAKSDRLDATYIDEHIELSLSLMI